MSDFDSTLAGLGVSRYNKKSTTSGTTLDTKDKAQQAMEKFGFTVLPCDQQYNVLGEADWKPFVQRLKDWWSDGKPARPPGPPPAVDPVDELVKVAMAAARVAAGNRHADSH